jgi:hypothetical protein
VLAPSADRVDVFLEPDRDLGGRLIGSAGAPRSPTDTAFRVNVTVPADGHTLYVHVVSAGLRQEQVFTIPIVVRF